MSRTFGIAPCVLAGFRHAKGDAIIYLDSDLQDPPELIIDMYKLITEQKCELVSATRYSLGGKRYGGSFLGHSLSRFANYIFKIITGSIMTDCTTGIKMFDKKIWTKINPESNIGWSFAFELSIKAQILNYKIGEVPIISVDRLFGGQSTFLLSSWTKGYLKWFFYGVKNINYFNRKQKKVITIKN